MDDIISDDELLARFPGYPVNRDSAPHYRGRLERRLLINRCRTCGTWHHTPEPICPACWSTDVVPTEVSGAGTLFMTIFLHQGPPAEGVDYSTPYPVVTAALDDADGVRFTTTVVGATNDEIRIGERVELDWIDRGDSPLPVFRLVKAAR
jgi:uncharacterized OB-fold protein